MAFFFVRLAREREREQPRPGGGGEGGGHDGVWKRGLAGGRVRDRGPGWVNGPCPGLGLRLSRTAARP